VDELPHGLQHLKNIINKAKKNVSAEVLREVIKTAADEAPDKDIIRIAELILKIGIESHHSGRN
jgi:hypothetical protein